MRDIVLVHIGYMNAYYIYIVICRVYIINIVLYIFNNNERVKIRPLFISFQEYNEMTEYVKDRRNINDSIML